MGKKKHVGFEVDQPDLDLILREQERLRKAGYTGYAAGKSAALRSLIRRASTMAEKSDQTAASSMTSDVFEMVR